MKPPGKPLSFEEIFQYSILWVSFVEFGKAHGKQELIQKMTEITGTPRGGISKEQGLLRVYELESLFNGWMRV